MCTSRRRRLSSPVFRESMQALETSERFTEALLENIRRWWCNKKMMQLSLISLSGDAFLCSRARDCFTMLLDPFQGAVRVCSVCADRQSVWRVSGQPKRRKAINRNLLLARKMQQKASGDDDMKMLLLHYLSPGILSWITFRASESAIRSENTHGEAKGLKFVYFSFEKWLTSVNLRLFVGIAFWTAVWRLNYWYLVTCDDVDYNGAVHR